MKLVTYVYEGKESIGFLTEEERKIVPLSACGLEYDSMLDFLRRSDQAEREALSAKAAEKKNWDEAIEAEKATILAPIPHPAQDVICLGINYMAHAEESARYSNETFGGERPFAVYFSKRVAEAVRPGGEIQGHFDLTERLDYEAELAVVIGKDAKDVAEEDAAEYVFGYTILNDVSARELQSRHKQWYFGKSLDGFTPIGPCLVTKDEFAFPPVLPIRSRINGEIRQDSSTGLLIFGIPHIIAELSKGMTLKAGTIIATGTPAGAGMGFTPPRFLKAGDVVECEIEGIGVLRNTVSS